MHRYNNQGSTTAMAAVENIKNGVDKSAIWEINTEQEYHEDKSDATTTVLNGLVAIADSR